MAKAAALLAQCPPPPADAGDLPIHVERVGAGPTVLIIHGGVQGGGGPVTFAKQRALAEQGWQLAFVERPGFGRSPSRGPDDMAADAVWIADLLEDGAHLIGHSWGGAVALLASGRRPDAVRSLVLVEPALQVLALTDPATSPAARAAIGQLIQPLMTAQTPAEYGRAAVVNLGAVNAETVRARASLDDAAAARTGCALLHARMAPPPLLHQAARTVAVAGIPVLVITGGWSPAWDAVGAAVARITRGRQAIVASRSHFPQSENPAAFNAVVDAFMRTASAAAITKPHSASPENDEFPAAAPR